MKLFERDWYDLQYIGSFNDGSRIFRLPGDEKRWRRLARAGYVTLESDKSKRDSIFRTVAVITPAGREALAAYERAERGSH